MSDSKTDHLKKAKPTLVAIGWAVGAMIAAAHLKTAEPELYSAKANLASALSGASAPGAIFLVISSHEAEGHSIYSAPKRSQAGTGHRARSCSAQRTARKTLDGHRFACPRGWRGSSVVLKQESAPYPGGSTTEGPVGLEYETGVEVTAYTRELSR